jgi:murein DD-endopeptidase MepM/ murein hydrolase activator NlpD
MLENNEQLPEVVIVKPAEEPVTKAEAPKKEPLVLSRPVSSLKQSDDFKDHIKRKSVNPGSDFPVAYGSAVKAAHDGKVTIADNDNGGAGGRMIEITSGKLKTQYLHLSKMTVKNGQKVKAGQVIGLVGGSGFGKDRHYGTHLHFAVKLDGKNLDPMKHLK